MKRKQKEVAFENLPGCAIEFIKLVIRKMRYRKKVRADVMAELVGHFEDELKNCTTDDEKEQKAQKLIEDFGDVKLLAVLLRRAKKRCRPLWQKAIVRSLAVIGVIILYLLLCSARLIIGKPSVKVDYTIRLEELASQGRDESLNARRYFDRAVELAGEGPSLPEILEKCSHKWPGDMNEPQRQAVVKLLAENQASFDALKQGLEKPYYWADYTGKAKIETDKVLNWELVNYAKDQRAKNQPWYWSNFMGTEFIKNTLQSLAGYRRIAQRLALQILWKAYTGDVKDALNWALVLHKFGARLQGKGLLTEQLVGTALEGLASEKIFTVLDKIDVQTDVLKNIQEELERQCNSQEAIINLQAEKVFWYDYIQRTFTDDGKGSGRVLKQGLPLVTGDLQDTLIGFFFGYPDRKEFTAIIDQYFEQTNRLMEIPPLQLQRQNLEWDKLEEIANKCFMLEILGPAYIRVNQIKWRCKTGRAALLTTLSILRYKKDTGVYPKDLDILISDGYLKNLPIDPYSNKPLVYKKTENSFTIYSVGCDLTDDNGEYYQDQWGQIRRKWADSGDWVFWPVVK